MTIGELAGKKLSVSIVAALLLAAPGLARASASFHGDVAGGETWQGQESQDREQEARDREQEKRDREQEARDRAQEKRDREQERADRLEELYDEGREALDEDRYDQALSRFRELAEMNGANADAALYWQAYAENRLAKKAAALATIGGLKKRFPQSRWIKDASVLEMEVNQSTGQPPNPDAQNNEELKMLALQSLIRNNPEKGIPMVEGILSGSGSPRLKSKALFLLAQSGSPQSREILGKIARGQGNPELQRKAVEYLGIFGGAQARQTLVEVYASSTEVSVKHAILRSFMIGGDREHLLAAAKSEKDESLRGEAVRQLGISHGAKELKELYQTESSPEIRREIMQAFFLAGDAGTLAQAAQSEKDPGVRRSAIRNLGLIHSDEAGQALVAIYGKETDKGAKEEVLNAFFLQGNAHALVTIARSEKDPELKRTAVSKLSLMHSKEATDYLMELLQK